MAVLSNGNSQDVTAQATWSSSNPQIAEVVRLNTGAVVANGWAFGIVDALATYQNITGRVSFSVVPSPCQVSPDHRDSDQTFALNGFSQRGSSQGMAVMMTKGGAECSWLIRYHPPNSILQTPILLTQIKLNVLSQGGATVEGPCPSFGVVCAHGQGNGSVLITIGASPGGVERGGELQLEVDSPSVQGALIGGVTSWAAGLFQNAP
jgi:hypothetical protein